MSKKLIIILVIILAIVIGGGIYGYSVYKKNKAYEDCVETADNYWKSGIWGTDSKRIAEFVEECTAN